MTMIGSPWDVPTDVGEQAPAADRPDWFDDLVTLHVLTSHGDAGAADDVARWAASDPVVARLSAELRDLHRASLDA
ncbi:hypothetical protein [Actinomycetospora chiangmaiensis]|uniref:hypothetical protein n=1 Tax=Actinomycetospora chiangmaiensis TaxID=402650 RepID=UPI00035FCF57|nr:hypothetical protein [Actinomycetospora chiangmaiensis]